MTTGTGQQNLEGYTAPDAICHQLADFLRLIGMRDRLRCPRCKAVGTYKPHGGWLDFGDSRRVRRWMCKWCGFYRGPETDTREAVPSMERGCWVLRREFPEGKTPREVVRAALGACWPWRG